MAKSDNEQAERVRSARTWLEKAEKSFDEHASVRGELNLMLAEAEMKNLRKNHQSGWKLRRLTTAGAILLSVLAIAGSYILMRYDASTPVLKPQRQISELPSAAVSVEERQRPETVPAEHEPESQTAEIPAEQSPPASLDTPQDPERTEREQKQNETAAATEKAPAPAAVSDRSPASPTGKVMTDREVQAAVQDARHSLRGTAEKK